MKDVYDQHRAAFRNVAAYVIIKDGKRIGNVALKYGNQVTAYVHCFGCSMVKGFARGGGYDRATAAVQHAISKQLPSERTSGDQAEISGEVHAALICGGDSGQSWDRMLQDEGFEVMQAL